MEKEKFVFRLLHADEIEVRIGRCNQYGVSLLLYKDARADMAILDEHVGSFNWKKTYTRDNRNCIVELWDEKKNQWIAKEDTGTESFTEKEKGLASDSFKRACVNWGIGRELYTAPEMFVKADMLQNFKNDGNKQTFNDEFYVEDIAYDEEKRRIKAVKIGIGKYGKIYNHVIFSNGKTDIKPTSSQSSTTQAKPQTATTTVRPAQSQTMQTQVQTKPQAQVQSAQPQSVESLFADDEQILIGNCSTGTYGEMKNTSNFQAFLSWVRKNPGRKYPDPKKQDQFNRFEILAAAEK